MRLLSLLSLTLSSFLARAHYAPAAEDVLAVSTDQDGAHIDAKEVPDGTCGSAKSYAGYARFPPNSMKGVKHDYPINTFFWYFKAKENAEIAPLVIWMNGGPGASSMFGLFTENGPCHVNRNLTTRDNPWAWNKEYNVLYLDQPVQTGFSYDIQTPGVLNLTTGNIIPNYSGPLGHTLIPGNFSSQNVNSTANTTENAARHFWNFLQLWTDEFKHHTTSDKSISIWTESYGGRYGPSFAAYIQQQNSRIIDKSLAATPINLTTLGIINGCIDLLTQETSNPEFAYDRNPYGIEGITRQNFSDALISYSQNGGCLDKIHECHHLADAFDPNMYGNRTQVNQACESASDFCQNEVEGPYTFRKKWAFYDITHCYLDPFPENFFVEYLATKKVRDALGVLVNYTDISNTVGLAFNLTGDYARRDTKGYLEDIAGLLGSGIQVSLIHGDRDFACNWIGGERVSLAVEYKQSGKFKQAGYADITTGSSSVGQVRQHGLFSFARVYQSGHMVPAYRPQDAYKIFIRAMQKKDIATGRIPVTGDYSTEGPWNSTTTLKPEPMPSPTCYLRGLPSTCADNQIEAVKKGEAITQDGIIIKPEFPKDVCPTLPARHSALN
ncbi:Alpha/Beta hydrolase protein [Aspergillus pseudocaelatus]|uniref:Carboxypeptidase n=1 Tax=Aspergillus pseudocaelatus TaxID=1825620 RepID=A0ABQ6WYR4_9EURO|nr:Alpha/Beta hydrolase protein [Aspergillus pseudocaelatus]